MILYDLPPVPIVQCVDCTPNEKRTLEFLQSRGIRSKNALAVVMGNIQQESRFDTLICEGGFRTGYHDCHRGGFGLIQWTTPNRYRGLGKFAEKYGGNVNVIDTQLRYMVNEPQWTRYELYLKSEDQSIGFYMKHAYNWLGWGIHGNRTLYSKQYLNRFSVTVPELSTIG